MGARHGPQPVLVSKLVYDIVDVAGRSDWQSPLYIALAPLALLRERARQSLILWAYVLYLFLTWWLFTHRIDRFWLPLLPVLAVLAGLGADWIRHWAWSILLGIILTSSIVANLVFDSTVLVGCFNGWTDDLESLRRRVPAEVNRPLAELDDGLPASSKVLLVGQASVFPMNHAIVYNTVFNKETIEILSRGRTPRKLVRRCVAWA